LIEQLRAAHPTEADVITAALRFRQSRWDEAAAVLEPAIVRLRTDPWPPVRFKQQALDLAAALGARQPAVARRLFDALGERFSVQSADTTRQVTRVNLAVRLDFPTNCPRTIVKSESASIA
jgi:hypothetical protein